MPKAKKKVPAKTKKASSKAKAAPKAKRKRSRLGANAKKWGTTTHNKGWTYVPNTLIEHQSELGITSEELNTILTLMKYWWERDKLPFPSVDRIAKQMGKSKSAVRRHTRSLEEKGYIKRIYRTDARKEKMNLTNEYSFDGLVEAVSELAKKKEK